MTSITPPIAADAADNYLSHRRGLWSWLTTLDHKRIGVMYLIGIFGSLLLGGVFSVLIRVEHAVPQRQIMDSDLYNQVFTLHGVVMIFLFIIPSIPAAFGNFVLPMMLGAKDVAFPRLNLLSWYLYVSGAIFAVASIAIKAVDTGWTFYTPYSTDPAMSQSVILLTFAAFVLGFSSILTGVNFIATIHMLRAPKMGWFDMPLFLWGLYATALIQVLATPVLGITLILLMAEKAFEVGIFNWKIGGDPVLYQHFFWFYSHPAVYIMILPAMGIVSEIISVFSRKQIFGYKFIAFSSVAIALLGFLVWGHHMYPAGQSEVLNVIFSLLTYSVAIPSAVKIFNWLATMYKGTIDLRTPMLYALAFILNFTIGGLTGLFLGALSVDVYVHDTYFVVAHFHYTMVGGTVFGFLGGLHLWWPKMFGRMYSELWGRLSCILMFVGFNVTFLPLFVSGSHGNLRRYAQIPEQFAPYHLIASIGLVFTVLGVVIMIGYLIHSLVRGRRAPANPWGGASLEWKTASPPVHDNFATDPTVGDPYDFDNLQYDEASDSYVPTNGK